MFVQLRKRYLKGIVASYATEIGVFAAVVLCGKALGIKSAVLVAIPAAWLVSWPVLIYYILHTKKKEEIG